MNYQALLPQIFALVDSGADFSIFDTVVLK